jgi:hypothetical protein
MQEIRTSGNVRATPRTPTECRLAMPASVKRTTTSDKQHPPNGPKTPRTTGTIGTLNHVIA